MVAFDVNAPDTPVLQGWLMHDQFHAAQRLRRAV